MNDQFIWLVKNSKVYKSTMKLLLGLRGDRILTVSPGLLFLSQHRLGTFNRYDIVVRMMAIDEIEGKAKGGLALYHKMQQNRQQFLAAGDNPIKHEDLVENKSQALHNLVSSFKENGFDPKSAIAVNPRLKLVDGSHRLACALYFDAGPIVVDKAETADIEYGMEWFQQYFNHTELQQIEVKYQSVVQQLNIAAILRELLSMEKQVFGRGAFYQSFEEIGIPGQRPTAERYQTYKLDEHLLPGDEVLDIGCNCGFFTLKIAEKVKSACGIEITQALVDIAQVTQVYLGRKNATFMHGNFNPMTLDQKFDFICSFAVHHWLGADMHKYGQRLHQLLNPGGRILIESQNVHNQDQDWDHKLSQFMKAGFHQIDSGTLKDDEVIERRFSVLRKN